MGRPKGGTNKRYGFELKSEVVQKYLEGYYSARAIGEIYDIHSSQVKVWTKQYQEEGELGLRPRKRGNPYAALHTSKSLSEVERLKLENFKLKVENERLKKGYMVKGDGQNQVYATRSGKIIK